MVLDDISLSALIDAHWSYLESVLKNHRVPSVEIAKAKRDYRRGFLAGYTNLLAEDYRQTSLAEQDLCRHMAKWGFPFHYRTACVHGAKHRKEDER